MLCITESCILWPLNVPPQALVICDAIICHYFQECTAGVLTKGAVQNNGLTLDYFYFSVAEHVSTMSGVGWEKWWF